jgi:hypothetical protein
MISLHTSLASLSNLAELPHPRCSPRAQPSTGYHGASLRQKISSRIALSIFNFATCLYFTQSFILKVAFTNNPTFMFLTGKLQYHIS